jgi:hypothetical protein
MKHNSIRNKIFKICSVIKIYSLLGYQNTRYEYQFLLSRKPKSYNLNFSSVEQKFAVGPRPPYWVSKST